MSDDEGVAEMSEAEAGEPDIESPMVKIWHNRFLWDGKMEGMLNGAMIHSVVLCDMSPADCRTFLVNEYNRLMTSSGQPPIPDDLRDRMILCLAKGSDQERLTDNPNIRIVGDARHFRDIIQSTYFLLATEEGLEQLSALPPQPAPSMGIQMRSKS